jgi:hypothetical protein
MLDDPVRERTVGREDGRWDLLARRLENERLDGMRLLVVDREPEKIEVDDVPQLAGEDAKE